MTRRRLLCVFLSQMLVACRQAAPTEELTEQPAPRGRDRFQLVNVDRTATLGPERKPLARGFGLSVLERRREQGQWVGITRSGLKVRLAALKPAEPSSFAGVALWQEPLSVAWVINDQALVLAEPLPQAAVLLTKRRLARVRLLSHDGPEGYLRIRAGWMRQRDLAVPVLASRPATVGPRERWLDVDLTAQTLVAYEGDRPVFATLVSTGVGAPGTVFATPKGTHRIQSKLIGATMDNLEHEQVVPYFYEEVPFSQYIGRVALHGVYWHDRFGHPMSHGCINLSLSDAEYLFEFTRPSVLPGKDEIASFSQQGSVIRVH